jgi:hypothetical protein
MASEEADHMSCPLHACPVPTVSVGLHVQPPVHRMIGQAPVVARDRSLSIVPISHSVAYRVQAMKAYSYVQCRDDRVCEICTECIKCCVRVQFWCRRESRSRRPSCVRPTQLLIDTFLPHHNKSLHDDSITQFDVIRISQQLVPTLERSSVEMMVPLVIMPALHTVRTPR